MNRQHDSDLSTPTLPLMAWTPDATMTSLSALYRWVEQVATDSIAWYLREKQPKARRSRRLRAVALILATLGGTIPVVALAARRPDLGNWGYLLLALSAGALAYDRFFGYSSAWQRYLATATALRADLADFQLAWANQLAALGAQAPGRQDVQHLITMAQAFTKSVNDSVRAETEAWLTDFNTRLAEIEHRLTQPGPAADRI